MELLQKHIMKIPIIQFPHQKSQAMAYMKKEDYQSADRPRMFEEVRKTFIEYGIARACRLSSTIL